MSNISKNLVPKVIPYCQDPMSSCGLFAWGENTGSAPAGTIFKPMFFSGLNAPKKPSSSYLPPPCPEGYSGKHPNCIRNESKEKFSGFNLGDIFGGGAGSSDVPDLPFGKPQVDLDMPDSPSSSGGNGGKISPDQIMSGLESAAGLAKLFGTKRELSEVEGVCGKQPKGILRSKATKQAWANCASAYMQSKLDEANKSKGLSARTWIGIGLGVAAIAGGAIFFATRKKGQQKTVMMQSPQVIRKIK